MSASILLGVSWTAASGLVFLVMVLRQEWSHYTAQLRKDVDKTFGHQHNLFPDYKRFSRMWDEEGSQKRFYPLATVEWKALCRSDLRKHRETARKADRETKPGTTGLEGLIEHHTLNHNG